VRCAEERLTTSFGRDDPSLGGRGSIGLGSFGWRPSLDVGAARRRAVTLCQGAQVPSIDGNSSPSNHCLERTVMRLWEGAASARKECALASPWTRLRAAAQARR
jgi:hypothetical protein